MSQQVGDAQRSIEEKRAHAQQSLEQYQKVRRCAFLQSLFKRAHIIGSRHRMGQAHMLRNSYTLAHGGNLAFFRSWRAGSHGAVR